MKKIFRNIDFRKNKLFNARTNTPQHKEDIVNKEYVDNDVVYETEKSQEYSQPFKFNWLINPNGKRIKQIFDDLFYPRILPIYLNPDFKKFELKMYDGVHPDIIVLSTPNNIYYQIEITTNDRLSTQAVNFNFGGSTFIASSTNNTLSDLQNNVVPTNTDILLSKQFAIAATKQDSYGDDYVAPGFNIPYTLSKNTYPEKIKFITPLLYANLSLNDTINSLTTQPDINLNDDVVKFNSIITLQPNTENNKTILIPKTFIDGINISNEYQYLINNHIFNNFYETIEIEWNNINIEYYIFESNLGYYLTAKNILFNFISK